ncbi:DUF6660 family protein [Flavicella sediminum]|uniref:DUF6660 family protein n=1 Tax=Flavicella sediminum TaxID=2585141 RepID=UPI00111D8ABD|nr:DUF6660 family protein [Flavicella sediminum]
MKFLALILSIYIFVLNLVPCDDYLAHEEGFKTEISQAADHEHQHQGTDLCSPFCICQCCHVNAIQIKFVNEKFAIAYFSTQDFFYLSGTEKDFTSSILQPPRA